MGSKITATVLILCHAEKSYNKFHRRVTSLSPSLGRKQHHHTYQHVPGYNFYNFDSQASKVYQDAVEAAVNNI